MDLGNRILELRKKNGLSQEKLGEKINVTRQTISNWELEETSPNPTQLKLLSEVFNVSIDELLNNNVTKKFEDNKKMTSKFKILSSIILVLIILILFYYLGTFFGKFIANLGI